MATPTEAQQADANEPRPARVWRKPELRFVGEVRELIGGAMKSGPEMDGDVTSMGSPKRGQA